MSDIKPLPPLPANAGCPRCGQAFRCGVADAHCACFGLDIGPQLRQQLARDYRSCLCVDCLKELQQAQKMQADEAPTGGVPDGTTGKT